MNEASRQVVYRVTRLTLMAAVAFWLFFGLSKREPFRSVNPFADDPYDAVGSLAFQVAVLVGLLSYARALRLRADPGLVANARLILRGNAVVLIVIALTLVTDTVAVVRESPPWSSWLAILLLGLVAMWAFLLRCVFALTHVQRSVETAAPPRNLTPAEGLDDLWTLVRVPAMSRQGALPGRMAAWVDRWKSESLFSRAEWLDPRRHQWRFALALGSSVGLGLAAAQLAEGGGPPNIRVGFLVAAVFVVGEALATLLGFAALGPYLGLRATGAQKAGSPPATPRLPTLEHPSK